MTIKTGHIYWFKYAKHVNDPEPLVLVLWPGKGSDWNHVKPAELMHGINLNYLAPALTTDLVKMIARIAAGRLSGGDTYRLYHDHMKRALHPVIKAAYRTYDPDGVRSVKEVSRGFSETTKVLDALMRKFGSLPEGKEREVERLVKGKIDAARSAMAMFGPSSRLTPDEAERRAREYMAAIAAAREPGKIDPKAFTMLYGRRRPQ